MKDRVIIAGKVKGINLRSYLALFAILALFFGLIAYGHADSGTAIESTVPPSAVGKAPFNYPNSFQRVVHQIPPEAVDELQRQHTEQWLSAVGTLLLSMILGAFCATFFWHVRGWKRYLALIVPILGCGFAMFNWTADPMNKTLVEWGVEKMGLFLAFDLVGVWAGLQWGRVVARALLKLFIPPKARQHLAFLWTIDGKVLPPARERMTGKA